MRVVIQAVCTALLAIPAAFSQEGEGLATAETRPIEDLPGVLVEGAHPAPGLWEVTRDGKTLWIMETRSPAPKRMVWTSEQIEAPIAQVDLILGPPGVVVGTDVGLLRGAMLLPAYLRSKKNPGGKTLEDVLAPSLFSRWSEYKQRHLRHDPSVDGLRPLYAAEALFDAAVVRAGMTDDDLVEPVVKLVTRKQEIPIRPTKVTLKISEPQAALKRFNTVNLSDHDCLEQTMDGLDRDLSLMAVRANAWADGDVEQLRLLPFVNLRTSCERALMSSEIAAQQGIANLQEQVKERWLAAVRDAFARHDSIFATVPIARLLEEDGLLAALRDEGSTVNAP